MIRQAADVFVSGRFGDSEVWRGADFVAQQRGGWLRKAADGVW